MNSSFIDSVICYWGILYQYFFLYVLKSMLYVHNVHKVVSISMLRVYYERLVMTFWTWCRVVSDRRTFEPDYSVTGYPIQPLAVYHCVYEVCPKSWNLINIANELFYGQDWMDTHNERLYYMSREVLSILHCNSLYINGQDCLDIQ